MALKVEKTLSRTAAPAVFDSAPRYTKDEAMSELTKRFPDIVERMRRSLIEEGEDAGVPRIMRYRELKQLDCIGFTVRFHRNGLTISSRLTNDDLIYVAENCGILTSSEKAMVKPKGKTYTVKENAL